MSIDDELFAHAHEVLAPLAFEPAAKQMFAAIGRFESLYGIAGAFAPGGVPSFNWGALTGVGPAGFLVVADHDKDGNVIQAKFQRFPDAMSGLRRFLEIVIHPGTEQEGPAIDEANRGDASAFAARMFANHYYVGSGNTDEERIANYTRAIVDTARSYAKSVGEPLFVSASARPATSAPAEDESTGGRLLLGALALVGGIALVRALK